MGVTKTWAAGVSGSLWNATGNWSPSGVPVDTDDVVLTANWGAGSFINVNQNIGNVTSITVSDSTPTSAAACLLAGSTNSGTGTAWTLNDPCVFTVNFTVLGTNSLYAAVNNTISGTGKIIKRGIGKLHFWAGGTTTGWSGGMDIEAGPLSFDTTSVANKLGTGTLKFWNDTALVCLGPSGTGGTVSNPIAFNDSTALNWYVSEWAPTAPTSFNIYGRHLVTISGGIAFGNVTRSVYVGSANAVFSGALTGTAGFTKKNAGTLTLSNTSSGLSGNVSVEAGTLTNTTVTSLLPNASINMTGGTFTVGLTNTAVGNLSGTSGTVAMAALSLSTGASNNNATFSADITGTAAGTLTKTGTGTWTVASTLSRTGPIVVSDGTLYITATDALSNSSSITVNAAKTLAANGATYRANLKALTLNANSTLIFGAPA